MATWEDVRRLALALPETTERPSYDGLPAWRVKDKLFVWDRPLRKRDREDLGESAPDGPILGASVPDLGVKEALIADARPSTSRSRTWTATRRSWFAWTASRWTSWRSWSPRRGCAKRPNAWRRSTAARSRERERAAGSPGHQSLFCQPVPR
ncbi:hypothetical protein GCM10010492_01810 [Saccharothrix mutabilis subsp. mutabilis]|uniref:Uncharacterized protein n=1 Tax=Saccharothrix mutabilis subsp. mutabilis TaxID=66855 RepID=A0ABP3CJU4_9PSEU